MSIFRRTTKPLSATKVRDALRLAGTWNMTICGGEYSVYDPRRKSGLRGPRENIAAEQLVVRFITAIANLASRDLAATQTQSLLAQASALPDAWAQRQALSDNLDRIVADVTLTQPELGDDAIDAIELVAEAKAAYRRSNSAVHALVDAITARVISAEAALAAQRLARDTTEVVYQRATQATTEIIGGTTNPTPDAADAALAAAGLGTGDLTWTVELANEARSLTESARALGTRAGLTPADFILAPSNLVSSP